MSVFRFELTAVGADGCDRNAQPGEKLHARCGKLICPDCLIFDFVQHMRMKGFKVGVATMTHCAGSNQEVIDDLVTNTRKTGQF